MTHIVTEVTAYDKKRWKVTLDEGAVIFLLYRGEMKQAGLRIPERETHAGTEAVPRDAGGQPLQLPEEAWEKIREEILLPRAKKRALYFLKNGDKTEFQIRRKLSEAFYPPETVDAVLEFLKHYRLADDGRYTENYVNRLKGRKSRREIEAKLYSRGLRGDAVREALAELPQEDEYSAAEKALAGHCTGDRNKDYAYLARRGFSFDSIEHAFRVCGEETAEEETSGE